MLQPFSLRAAALVLVLLALTLGACGEAGQASGLDARQAWALIQQRGGDADFVVLDVRTPREFAAGHLAGAVNLDYYAADFRKSLTALNRDRVYLMYCHSGGRSGSALKVLGGLGFTDVRHMPGGWAEWQRQGLPWTK